MRRPLPLLTVLLPLALLAAAPALFGQDALTPSASGYTVRGTVVNAITSQPIARALVSINQDQAILTDSSGQFSLANIGPGSYPVSVSKPGYQVRGFGVMRSAAARVRPGPPFRIQVGPGMPPLTFAIAPLSAISGHVTLSTADPPNGIRVQVFYRQLQNGHPHWTVAGQARVRYDGSFRIGSLQPGSYRLATLPMLDRPGLALNRRGPVWGYPALYYPGTTDIGAAGVLTLGAGQQAEADITLTRQQFFPVTALVQGSPDTPANFEILDSGGRQTGLYAQFDRRDGLAHAAVPNGTWTMEAHVYGPTMEWGSTSFQVNGAPVSFSIAIQPVPHVPVIIHRDFQASDGPQSGAGPGMNLQVTSADEMTNSAGNMRQADNPASGSSWEVSVSQPGRYWIQALPYPPLYVSSITSGGSDLGSTPLVFQPGSTPQPIEVTLRNDSGTINGTIVSQNPGALLSAPGQVPQIWIYAIPLFSSPSPLRNVMPNSDGQFSFYGVAPGSYRLVACDSQQEIDFHSPDALAAWAGKGQTVTVDPGGTASAELTVLHIASGAAQ